MRIFRFSLLGLAMASALTARAEPSTVDRPIPDEYTSLGGHALGLNEGGMAALSGPSAVRANPAMLSLERLYSIEGSWHWPSRGREFYDVGVVDSKTSSMAAGFVYHGYREKYRADGPDAEGDSPISARMALGLSQTFNVIAVGIGGEYVEARDIARDVGETVAGATLNVGVAGLLTPAVRVGASIENLANDRVRDYAPRVTRLGAAWVLSDGVTAHLDLRDRQRVLAFEGGWPKTDLGGSSGEGFDSSERTLMASFSARFRDMLTLVGGYTYGLTDDRRSLAAGIALVQQTFSLAYGASVPNLLETRLHHTISLNLKVNF